MVAREGGFTVIECMVALAILVVVAGGMVLNDQATLREVADSFDALAASRCAAGRIDAIDRRTLAPRTREFEIDDGALPGCIGVERIRAITAGGTSRTQMPIIAA